MNDSDIRKALDGLESWVERVGWKAYDTFDGLASPYAPILTFGNPFLKQVWQQGVRRFPLNLRPLLGIKPSMSSKAMGFFAQGHLRLYQTRGETRHLEKMNFCLEWLKENHSPGFKGLCWGNHFNYQHRAGSIPKGTPTIVWTGLIGHAFLDAYEALDDSRYLEICERICEFIVDELGMSEFEDSIYLHYYPGAKHFVHNSNMIGASLLARAQHHNQNERWLDFSRKAVRWTMLHQLPNGAWHYGVGPRFRWVDSFHTAYVLESLDIYNRYTRDQQFSGNLERGYRFYVETFFGEDGTPRYYDQKMRPLDIQCASQGIQTLVNLCDLHPQSITIAKKVSSWVIRKMQAPEGYFYYRKYPFITNKTPTMHWGQATMFAALAALEQHLASAVEKSGQRRITSAAPLQSAPGQRRVEQPVS